MPERPALSAAEAKAVGAAVAAIVRAGRDVRVRICDGGVVVETVVAEPADDLARYFDED